MTRSLVFAWAVVASLTIYLTSASADNADKKAPAPAAAPDGPPKPGAETKALSPLAGTFTGTGKLQPGAMGPGSPELPTKAKHACKWTLNNLWLQCDITDTAGTGKQAFTWMGQMLIGWDFQSKAYRSVGVDNMGSAFDLNAKLDGAKFIMESAHEQMMMGTPVKFRFTFDFSDAKLLKFTDERSMKGGPWQLAETVSFKKSG